MSLHHLTTVLGQLGAFLSRAIIWISPLLSAAGVGIVKLILDWWGARHIPKVLPDMATPTTSSDDFKFVIEKLYDQLERSDREAEQSHHELEQTRAALQVAHDEAHRAHEVMLDVMTRYDISQGDLDLLNSIGVDIIRAQRNAAAHLKAAQEHLDESKVAQQTLPQHLEQIEQTHDTLVGSERGNGDADPSSPLDAGNNVAPA